MSSRVILRTLRAGFRIVRRQWVRSVVLVIGTVVCAYVTAVMIATLADLWTEVALVQKEGLEDNVFFQVEYTQPVPIESSGSLDTAWNALLSAGAYSTIRYNYAVEDPRVIAVVGDFSSTYGFDSPTQLPALFLGARVDEGTVEAAPADWTRLPEGARYFDPAEGAVALDDRVILAVEPSSLGGASLEEAIWRTVSPPEDDDAISQFVARARESGLILVPSTIGGGEQRYGTVASLTATTGVATASSLVAIAGGLVTYCTAIAEQQRRSLGIRRLLGASSAELTLGFVVGMALLCLIPAVPPLLLISAVLPSGPVAAGAVGGLLTVGVLVAAVRVHSVLTRTDIAEQLRSGE